MIIKFLRSFSEYSSIFFQNFNKYYSKLIPFLIFAVLSRQFLIDILSGFFTNFSIFFLKIKLSQIFIQGLLKNFLAIFQSDLKFFFDIQIIFLK